jgi:hypothetical protein
VYEDQRKNAESKNTFIGYDEGVELIGQYCHSGAILLNFSLTSGY